MCVCVGAGEGWVGWEWQLCLLSSSLAGKLDNLLSLGLGHWEQRTCALRMLAFRELKTVVEDKGKLRGCQGQWKRNGRSRYHIKTQEQEELFQESFGKVCQMYWGNKPGWLVGKSARLVIERLRVWIPAGAAGEFSSPELTLCANSYSVSVPLPCYCSDT